MLYFAVLPYFAQTTARAELEHTRAIAAEDATRKEKQHVADAVLEVAAAEARTLEVQTEVARLQKQERCLEDELLAVKGMVESVTTKAAIARQRADVAEDEAHAGELR